MLSQVPLAPQTTACIRLQNVAELSGDGQRSASNSRSPAQGIPTASEPEGQSRSTFHAMLAGRNGSPAAFPIPIPHRQVSPCNARSSRPHYQPDIPCTVRNVAPHALSGQFLPCQKQFTKVSARACIYCQQCTPSHTVKSVQVVPEALPCIISTISCVLPAAMYQLSISSSGMRRSCHA